MIYFAVSSDTWIADHGNGVFRLEGHQEAAFALSFDRLEPLGTKNGTGINGFGMAGKLSAYDVFTQRSADGCFCILLKNGSGKFLKAWMRRGIKKRVLAS